MPTDGGCYVRSGSRRLGRQDDVQVFTDPTDIARVEG